MFNKKLEKISEDDKFRDYEESAEEQAYRSIGENRKDTNESWRYKNRKYHLKNYNKHNLLKIRAGK